MFRMVDAIHFNSQSTADVYGKYIDVHAESKVVAITHRGVEDHRKRRYYSKKVLRLGFIGSETPYKGLPILKRVITMLNADGLENKIELNVYGGKVGIDKVLPNVLFKGRFSAPQMKSVYDSMDLLVVPSIWYETFSLTTLEALSYGVPVLVSDSVGAQDIVKEYDTSYVYHTEEELRAKLQLLANDKSELVEYNKRILSQPWKHGMREHAQEVVDRIYKSSE